MNKQLRFKAILVAQLLICTLFTQLTFGQNEPDKYEIKTTTGKYKLTEFKNSDFKTLTGVEFKNKHFRLVQFYEIPTEIQRKSWKEQGMTLLDYLSANTYYASIDKGFPIKQLKGIVRSISPVDTQYKKEGTLFSKGDPTSSKKTSNNAEYILSYYKDLNLTDILTDLKSKGVQILRHRDYSYQIDVVFDESQLETITNLPYVQFIGAKPDEPINETYDYRNSTGRSNYLNSGYNGLNYNGSGVVIGIGEADNAGNEIDFKGRITEFITSNNSSSHKIGCTQNAGGAGNSDPADKNNAWGATLLSLDVIPLYSDLYNTNNLRYTNHSYGLPIGGGYDSYARDHDLRITALPNHLVSYSSGNSGTETGIAPYAFSTWANITGARKENKNQISVGALSPEDEITSFSSRGPMYDGRIIPQLAVEGSEGTSYASPKVVGNLAILAQVYKEKNGGTEPASSLLRAIMMNTADDLGNPGPDFIYGYGRPNLRRAYNIIKNNQFITSSITNGVTNNHTIDVPANVKQVRVMIVWPDVAASVNAATAIVNNLNLSVTDASSTTFNPWVLDSSPSVASISAPATRGVDNLNTIEQVTIDNPATGNCTVNVNGINVPSGPQTYYLVYEFLYDELQIAFPLENQKFISGETYYIRWDSYGSTDTFNLSYELNNSGTWVTLENAYNSSKRVYKWIAPNVSSGMNTIKFKVQRNSLTSISGINQIGKIPENFRITKVCGDVVNLKWSAVTGATSYKVYKLGAQYMEEVNANITYSVNSAVLTAQSTTASEYYAVSALTGTVEGQRTLTIEKVSGDSSCNAISWTGSTSADWFDGTNWATNAVPTSSDDIVIASPAPFQPVISATAAACGSITINSGASLTMDSSTAYTLSVSKDWVNNGTFNSGIGTVDFVNTTSYQEITGTATTGFNILKVTKGTQDKILEINSLITLKATSNPLVITSGTFKLSSASTITPFTSAPTITELMGFWNNGGTVNGGAFGWTLNKGLLKISAGTTNIGTSSGNSIVYLNNGTLVVEGGDLNIASRIQPNSSTSSCIFNQSGGVITVFKVGSTSTTNAPFEMGINANCTISGGTIVIQKASSNYADYVNIATSNSITGGTLQIGNGSTSTSQTIRINSTAPIYNLSINSFNAPKAQLVSNNLTVKNNITISGGTLDTNALDIVIKGNWINNGTFLPNIGKVSFEGYTNQTLTGATTFYNLKLNNSEGLTLLDKATINNNFTITAGVVNLGTITHTTNTLTIGDSGTVLGSWGNTTSSASNTNNSYFAATTGIINVASCGTYASWTGAQDTSWTNSYNWSSCGVPTSTSDVTINSGTFQPAIASNVTINSLTISSGANLTLTSGYNLNLSNAINNAGTLTIKNNANLIQTNNVTNTGVGVANIERDSSPLFRLDYTLWSSPVSGTQTLENFSPLTLTNRFYEYNTTSDLYNLFSNSSNFSLAKSYLIRMPNTWVSHPGTAISWTGIFTGTPNNGNINYTLSTTGNGYNAVGNPYPSTLNINSFISGNTSNIDGTLYFWRKTNDVSNTTSYSTCTTAGITGGNSHTYADDNFISVGQGFIVKATSGTLNFTNSMREANNTNQFFKTKAIEKNRIWLNLSNNTAVVSQMMLAYMTGATQGNDPTIDGKYMNDNQSALNSLIGNEEFAIQGRALPFDETDIVPLAFKTTNAGDYTIAIDHADGLFATGQDVYLVDSKTGIETNLNTTVYNFNADAGVDNTRFSLKYQNTLGTTQSIFDDNNVLVYKTKGIITVNAGNKNIDTIQVYDVQGKLLTALKNIKSNLASIKDLKTTNQVLVIKITLQDNKKVSRKIVN